MKPAHRRSFAFAVLFTAVFGLRSLHAQGMPTQTLMWSSPNPVLLYQPATLYAEVIGNGILAATGTVTFDNSGTPIGTGDVNSYTNTNLLLYSSQFSNQPWFATDNNSVLTPNYATSPLGD